MCNKCKIEKNINEFNKGNNKDELHCWCKNCCKEYKEKNKQKIQINNKSYRETHKEQIKNYDKIYRNNNKEKLRNYRKIHQESIKDQKKDYYTLNKEHILSRQKKYEKNRREIDINYKILCNLRRRLNHTIKNNYKSTSTINLLGCSIKQLKEYLESHFKQGMSWSNYGKWHIDHIKPCASFDLSKPNEQSKCFHYSNLQPLWAEDNLSKHDKII